MAKITYHEFRPGKWVKLVDGEVVGPAAPEDVAAWKREKLEQARIWEDVVKQTQAKGPDHKAEGPPGPHPREEDTDWAQQVRMWRDVVKHVAAAGPESERRPELSAAEPTLPMEVSINLSTPTPTAPAAQRASAKTGRTAAKPRPSPARGQKPEPATGVVADKEGIKPRPSSRDTVRQRLAPKAAAQAQPGHEPLPTASAVPTAEGRPASAPTASVPKAAATTKPGAKAAAEMVPEALSAQSEAAAAGKRVTRTRARDVGQKAPAARAKPPKGLSTAQAAPPQIATKQAEPAEKRQTSARRRVTPATSHRTPSKATAAHERPNQLYLWIAASAADDLVATLRTGLTRYQARFEQSAEVVLCHHSDLAVLDKANLAVDLRESKNIPPHNFWIGLK